MKWTIAQTHNNIGRKLEEIGKYEEASTFFRRAIEVEPNFAEAHYNLGVALQKNKELAKAAKSYSKALKINPNFFKALNNYLIVTRRLCDWKKAKQITQQLKKITKKEILERKITTQEPLLNILLFDDPKLNFQVAASWSKQVEKQLLKSKTNFVFDRKKRSKNKKIKIAYLSSDFHNHPTAHLMLSLFKLHDRKKFKVFVYSYGPNDGSDYFRKIENDCDCFVDIRQLNRLGVARQIYQDKIDILIDLKGHIRDSLPEVLAMKPAPIQVSWLGFPGTTGADFIDYLIADKVAVPKNHRSYYSEKLIYLPDSYQVNDYKQIISKKKFTRADFNLPEAAFVFVSFTQTYKIDPTMFEIWMKILKATPKSVLWLWDQNKTAKKNLKAEAKKLNVNPDKLIFSGRLPKEEHLARLKLAGLGLDTRIYNGHTSTSDLLWAGIPLVTLQGKHFASRVSSSLLTAIDMPELITHSLTDYEKTAISLANNTLELKKLKSKLAKNLLNKPLFNTPLFTKNLEEAYIKIWKDYLQ